uniref:Germ cell-specific gene 1-like protein n=1 Tax=Seriola dumerili TaxID=41447 RepID=A0A3B4VM69_SERDU
MRLEHGRRASLALTLNFVAFAFALSAVTTSYWCEGTRKVAKPFCTGPPVKVKQWFCIRFNSSNINDTRLVQYIFETGEEKFLLRKFHTGIFFSCEQAVDMNGKTIDNEDFEPFSIQLGVQRQEVTMEEVPLVKICSQGNKLFLVSNINHHQTSLHQRQNICRHYSLPTSFDGLFWPLWDGGPHDVYHHIPAGCRYGTRRLEAQDLGLQLVLCLSVGLFWHLHGFCAAEHREEPDDQAEDDGA